MFKQTLLALALGLASAAPTVQAADPVAVVQTEVRIIDTAGMQAAIQRGAIIWDVRRADDYNKGHIPGAVNVGDIGKTLRKDATEDYVSLPELEKVLGDAGIDPAREIVVYGDKASPYAYFGLFTVEYLNGRQGRIYHGGMDDWKAAGKPVSTEPTRAAPVALKLTVNPAVSIGTPEVIAAQKRKDVQIVDVRTSGEYAGDDIRAIRGGHIPGAVHIAYEQNWADPDTPAKLAKKQVANKDGMSLKSADRLKALYASLDPAKETIVYCQSGVRASETATVLKDLGFRNVKVYDSSWLGYGNTLDAPAENVQYFNVGALNGRLAAMQKRIDALEKALADSAKAATK
jgi:thiosulfate/3-mercaptopyruvate sulfurtransferase